jgi:hypothetical protein
VVDLQESDYLDSILINFRISKQNYIYNFYIILCIGGATTRAS